MGHRRPRRDGRRRREAPWAALALALALAGPAHAQPADRVALGRELGLQAVVDIDARTGTPRVLARLDGALTEPSSGSALSIATSYVRENLGSWGLVEDDLDAPRVRPLPGEVTAVHWPQSVDGVPVADRELRVNVAADGRVLSVLGAPAHGLSVSVDPVVSAGESVRAVQDHVGSHRPLVRFRRRQPADRRPERHVDRLPGRPERRSAAAAPSKTTSR